MKVKIIISVLLIDFYPKLDKLLPCLNFSASFRSQLVYLTIMNEVVLTVARVGIITQSQVFNEECLDPSM